MDFLSLIIWSIIGLGIGYTIFYFRYVDKKTVDELRNNLVNTTRQLDTKSIENKELSAQNLILKEKTTELLIKNEDLSKIVSELNRYYFHIKEAYTKANDLVNVLKIYDKDFEEKLKTMWGGSIQFTQAPQPVWTPSHTYSSTTKTL